MRRWEELRAVVITVVVLLMMNVLHTAHAKRGCSAFGHSCFGGHGKRTDPESGSGMTSPEEALYPGLQDVVFTAPRSDALLDAAAAFRRQQDQPYHLTPFLRQWLQAYRSSQDLRPNNM